MSSTPKSQDGAKPHPKKEFRCTVCRVTCLSEISYQAHIRGAKHLKALKSVRSFGSRDCQLPPPKKLASLKDYINDPDRDEPLIGLKYVEEGKKIKGKRHYRCTLCELDMAMQIMFDHLIGHKHRRSYLNRHFPLLIKGVQAPTVAVIKKLAKEVEEEEGIQTYATNVNIKLKPQTSKKKSSQNLSEQPSLEANPAEPMQTNADDFIENMANQIPEVAQNPEVAAQPPSFQGTENDYRTNLDGASQYKSTSKQYASRDSEYQSKRSRDYSSPQYKGHESNTKYSSSRDSEHQSKRYKDQSSSQYQPQAAGFTKSSEEYRSSKAYESGNRHSSTGYSKDYDKSSRTYDSGSSQPGSGYSKDYDKSARTYGSSNSQSSSGYNKDYDRSAKAYDSGNNQPVSGYSKGFEGSATTYDSGSQQPSYGYNKDSKTYESGTSHSSSAYNKGFEPSGSHQSSSGYNRDYDTSAKTYEPTSHSASGYDKGYNQQQASSDVQLTQQVMPSSGTAAANPGGLSPDILKILQGKDVPTVTSILSRLAQYYPPLQNVDISLLVSVLFESGALK